MARKFQLFDKESDKPLEDQKKTFAEYNLKNGSVLQLREQKKVQEMDEEMEKMVKEKRLEDQKNKHTKSAEKKKSDEGEESKDVVKEVGSKAKKGKKWQSANFIISNLN